MKKKSVILTFFLFVLLINFASAQTSQDNPLTQEQLEAFRSAKIARLVIKQSYGLAEGASFPFERLIRNIFENYAQCEVVGLYSPEYDLTIRINATGQAIDRDYLGSYQIGEFVYGGRWTLYTGASLSGSIELEIEGLKTYTKSFSGKYDPPQVAYNTDRDKPAKAPFSTLSHYFLAALFEMLGEIYGIDFIIAAHQGRVDTWGFYQRFREPAKIALANLGDKSVEPLIRTLNSEDRRDRLFAVEVLGKLKDPRAVDPLIRLLNDKNVDVRILAAQVLGEMGDPRAVEFLINSLEDKKTDVRVKVIEALGKVKDPSTVGPLIDILEDKKNKAQQAAAYALGQIKDPAAVTALIFHLKTKSSGFREALVSALGEYDDPRTIELLVTAMNDESGNSVSEQNRRICAAWALGRIGDPSVLEPLYSVLKKAKLQVTKMSLVRNALGHITDPRTIELMIASLSDNNVDTEIKGYIISAMFHIFDIHHLSFIEGWEGWWAENKEFYTEKQEGLFGIIR